MPHEHGLQTVRENRPVQPGGKLLHPAKQATPHDRLGICLQNAYSEVSFHHAEKFDDRGPIHNAVGVHDQHVLVVLPPSTAKVRDVTELGAYVHGATAVKKAPLRELVY